MKKAKVVMAIAFCLLLIGTLVYPGKARADFGFNQIPKIKVLTWNVYIGFDVFALLGSDDLETDIAVALLQLLKSNFPARAQAMAKQLIFNPPELIALQEVWRAEIPLLPLPPGIPNPTPVTVDYSEILELVLGSLGYVKVAENELTDISIDLETGIDSATVTLRILDRDVIFVKSDITVHSTNSFDYENIFKTFLPFPSENEPTLIESKRGLVEAVIEKDGFVCRFVNTHLEVGELPAVTFTLSGPEISSDPAQVLQARELVTYLDGETSDDDIIPIILAGDLNAQPTDEVSAILDVAGLTDMYPRRIFNRWDPGDTCCQNEDLLNRFSLLDQRIDYIRVRNDNGELPFTLAVPLVARVIGDRIIDKTNTDPRLWPSDHGGLRMTLVIPPVGDAY